MAEKKISRHSRRMRNPQLYVSGKRPVDDQYITEIVDDHSIRLTEQIVSWYTGAIIDLGQYLFR